MKIPPAVMVVAILGCALRSLTLGQEPAPGVPPRAPMPPPDPYEVHRAELPKAQWNVTVDVEMVALPQDLALPLLSDLRSEDDAKVESAVAQIQDLIKKKDAILMGWPIVVTVDGERGVSEAIVEKRYPTEFEPPQTPTTLATQPPPKEIGIVPNAFETRNVGATLEIEPTVVDEGRRILLNFAVSRVALLGFDRFDTGTTKDGSTVRVDQPQFASSKATGAFKIGNGQHALIGVYKLTVPENNLEFFIAHTVVARMK